MSTKYVSKGIMGITTAILVTLLLTTSTQAYIVPKDYQNKPYMTDYDVYIVSKANMGIWWADYNLDGLMMSYTNSGRCLACLDAKMEHEGKLLYKR